MLNKCRKLRKKLDERIQFTLRNINIRTRLSAAFILLAILPLIIITIVFSLTSYHDSEQRAIASNSKIATQTMLNISNTFDNYERVFEEVAMDNTTVASIYTYHDLKSYEQTDFWIQMRNKLASYVCNIKGIDSFEVRDKYGERFYCGTPITATDFFSSAIVAAANEQPLLTWSVQKKEDSRDTKDYIILSKNLFVQSYPNVTGCAVMTIDLSYIHEICSQIINYDDMQLVICDQDGTVISQSNNNQFSKIDSDLLNLLSADHLSGTSFRYNYEGTEYLISSSMISNTNWYVISLTSYSALMRSTYRNLFFSFSVMLLLAALCVIVTTVITRSIAQPVKILSDAMAHTTEMDFSERIDDKWASSRDELGKLTRGFNNMTSRLEYLIEENYKAEIQRKSLESLKNEAELNALQQQINPHFLYNTLETINWMAEANGESDIANMATALGSFFRKSISRGKEYISVEDEISNVRNYVYLQKIRFGDRFDVEWQIDPSLYPHMIIKLILQPLVENAIIHGMENLEKDGKIIIKGSCDDDFIDFVISDNGCGIPADRLKHLEAYINGVQDEHFHSIGVKNVHQRIKLYYGDEYGLKFESSESTGTTVKIHIPIQNNKKEVQNV